MNKTYTYLEADAEKSMALAAKHGISMQEAKKSWLATHKMNNLINEEYHDDKEYSEIWNSVIRRVQIEG